MPASSTTSSEWRFSLSILLKLAIVAVVLIALVLLVKWFWVSFSGIDYADVSGSINKLPTPNKIKEILLFKQPTTPIFFSVPALARPLAPLRYSPATKMNLSSRL